MQSSDKSSKRLGARRLAMRIWFGQKHDSEQISDILAVCLSRIVDPEQIPACLAAYPRYAAELEPLLRTALRARSAMAATVHEDRRLEARRQFLQAAALHAQVARAGDARRRARTQRPPSVLLQPLWSAFAPAIVAALLFVVAIVPIVSITSSSSLPGDWNYGFKRATERVRLGLTLDPSDRLNLELDFHNRRLGEIERLAADGRLNDPSLVQQLTDETSALVQSVSSNPQLGPSEALKVAQQTQDQVQALSDKVAPLASSSIKPAIDTAVQQTQQVQIKASAVAQAKVDSAAQTQSSTGSSRPSHGGSHVKSTLTTSATETPTPGATDTATPTPTSTATPSVTGTPGATATATASSTQTATATATAAGTAVASAPAPSAQPAFRTSSAPVRVLRPPANPQVAAVAEPIAAAPVSASAPVATPTPATAVLVPPAQPPGPPQIVVRQPMAAGQESTFVYEGPELPVPQALASISGAYEVVHFTQPQHGGQVYDWYPDQSNPRELLEPGSFVTVKIKPGAPATLTYVVPNANASH